MSVCVSTYKSDDSGSCEGNDNADSEHKKLDSITILVLKWDKVG